MESLGVLPDIASLPLIFKACGNLRALERGKKIHRGVEDSDFINDVRVRTSLIDLYSKCGCFGDAVYMFDGIPKRDVVAWNAMIWGCVECSEYEEVVSFVVQMQKENLRPNSRTVVSLLLACGQLWELGLGKAVHGYCLRNGILNVSTHVGSALIGFYSGFDVRIVHRVVRLLVSWSTVVWNSMITGYFDASDYVKVVELFVGMLKEGIKCDCVTVLVLIQPCAELGCLELGMQVHEIVIKKGFTTDLRVLNALMNMYTKMGYLQYSLDLFASVSHKDVVLWNSITSVYLDR